MACFAAFGLPNCLLQHRWLLAGAHIVPAHQAASIVITKH
jgi:hypothetical protein